jgi:predicted dehydrogenase
MKKKILVIGCGSIGERHLRCLLRTGRAIVTACDTNSALLEKIEKEYQVSTFTDLKKAFVEQKFDGVVICTPAHTHIAIALAALRENAALLIEKPLSISLDRVDELKAEVAKSKKFMGVAYVLHFLPSIFAMRNFLLGGTLGKPLQATVVAGQHFPTFRPAYREIYYNKHETGGGAIQDALTHSVNAVEWMLGPTTKLFCEAAHQSLEGVTVEDTVSVAAKNGDVLVNYSLNQFQAPNESTFQIHCENGSVKMELHEQRWGIFQRGEEKWGLHVAPVNHWDDLFVAQAEAFLDGIDGKPNPLCTLDEAIQTLKFNLAALESSRTGKAVAIHQDF